MFTASTVSALEIREGRDHSMIKVVETGMEVEWGTIDAGNAGEAICCTLGTVHAMIC